MGNVIVLLVIITIIGLAIMKIVLEKKKGGKCVGCPVYLTNTSGQKRCGKHEPLLSNSTKIT